MNKLSVTNEINSRKKSFAYALAGFKSIWRSEINFRIQVIATLMVLVLGLFFNLKNAEWIALLICIGMVLTAEIFNTAIEQISNFISPEIRPEIKLIKDIGASGVFVVALSSAIIGCIIFLPKLNQIIS